MSNLLDLRRQEFCFVDHELQSRLSTSGLNLKESASKRRTRGGGARRDRTDDLMLAKHALYQLSYGPKGISTGEQVSRSSRQMPNKQEKEW